LTQVKDRPVVFAVLFGFLLTACVAGEGEAPTTSQKSDVAIPSTTPSELDPAPDTTTTEPTPPTTASDRPLAPDFSLELGEGGTFTLSQADKPVYLVFWAEW
jgi:hypothetical protein